VINIVFIWFLVPETKNTSLEDMQRHFEQVTFPCENYGSSFCKKSGTGGYVKHDEETEEDHRNNVCDGDEVVNRIHSMNSSSYSLTPSSVDKNETETGDNDGYHLPSTVSLVTTNPFVSGASLPTESETQQG
jgi:hypothetical protein